jgi:hypothetical protein
MNNSQPYRETHTLPLNVYLLFYVYVFVILVLANLLPAWQLNYLLFMVLGLTAISVLFIKFTYSVSVSDNRLAFSINVPFRVALLKLKIEDIINYERIEIGDIHFPVLTKKKRICNYLFRKEGGIIFRMRNENRIIISGFDAERVISIITSLKANDHL